MSGFLLADSLAMLFVATREAIGVVAFATALSCLDDLAVDAVYFARRGWRQATVYRRWRRCRPADLRGGPQPPIAIVVPAWDEHEVIGDMLRHLVATLNYKDYRVFVGTYPNDPATAAAVDAVADHRIERVVVASPGPTTKADCLNALWRALLADEVRGIR